MDIDEVELVKTLSKNNSSRGVIFTSSLISRLLLLLDANLCAWVRATCERAFFDLLETYDAVLRGVNCEVAANVGTWTSNFGATSLANQDFSLRNFLPAKSLNTEARAGIVVVVFARTTSFNV